MTQYPENSLLSGHGLLLYGDRMTKSVGGDDHRQWLERVTEAVDRTALPDDASPDDFKDGDLQSDGLEDPSQYTDVGPLGDDTDPWDVFLTDGDSDEPEPERGDFWLDDL